MSDGVKLPRGIVPPQVWFPRSDILDRFKRLNHEHERMDFVMSLIRNTVSVHTSELCKNDDAAIKYRKKGNEMFVMKKELSALKMYNESITRAKPGSSLLGLAYGNRSAILFRKKFFKECLEDITRAFQSGYPENLKEKLLKRQEQAKQFLPNQVPIDYHDPPPTIENKNPFIQAASDLIELTRRGDLEQDIVVATKDIKGGDLLILEKPYASTVQFENKHLHCHECLELCFNMIPCDKCTVLYCSESCKQEAFASYHKYECILLQRSIQGGIFGKVIIISAKYFNTVNEDTENEGNMYRSHQLREILKSKPYPEEMDIKRLWLNTILACIIYITLEKYTDYFKQLDIQENVLKQYFYKLCMITDCTSVIITKCEKTCDISHLNTHFIGSGLYPTVVKMRRACSVHTLMTYYGSHLAVRAMCTFTKGEEIYHTGGFTYLTMDLLTRQTLMSAACLPKCSCKACIENWPTLQNLPEGPKLPADFVLKLQRELHKVTKTDERIFYTLLPEAVKLYDSLRKSEPNRNLAMIDCFICVVFMMTGNKMIKFR